MPPRLSSARGAVGRGEEQHVGHRHQRRALPARRHVARAEVAHHAHAEPLGQHRGLAQLPGDERRLVPDGLAVERRSAPRSGRRHLRLRQQRLDGIGRPVGQADVQPAPGDGRVAAGSAPRADRRARRPRRAG